MTPLKGKVIVITGGGRGLGRAFALHLARQGARLVINNRNRLVDKHGLGPADHVVAEIRDLGGEAVAEHGDVGDPATAGHLVELAMDIWGRIDACVTSAAVSRPVMFHRSTAEAFESIIRTNVLGTAQVAAACSVVMREQRYGRIVLLASTAGLHGEPTVSAYAASKGAVIALGRSIAAEGAPRGVHTNVLLPYALTQLTDTKMAEQYRDVMDPASVAPVVAALCDPACTLNGEVIVAAGSGLRAADAVEWGTVPVTPGCPEGLAELLARSRAGTAHRYGNAHLGFLDFAEELP
ncbi:putative short-chain type dehydrogenase/reductase [Acrocarpospora corrugata]|uniref:Putative short-chain type dehydrogenase/reductase n=1 Tax=Acrocarpospora corrugata TaxID=35763 RepID=A0A5M3W6P9_9ACTN|nr:SDR family NAD(P)-dependent oxidoreductase [Acrocarpospora corrugata]GES03999.1 putative short-chain type dehydrogenase/reductase [Acrocarpospora corrugata]